FASLIQGLSPIVQTRLIGETQPENSLFASFVSFAFMVSLLAPLAWRRMPKKGLKTPQIGLAVLFGLVASIVAYCGWHAFTLVNPSFVVAVAKTSIVFGVIFGAVFYHEKIRERLMGSLLMLGGVLLLVL